MWSKVDAVRGVVPVTLAEVPPDVADRYTWYPARSDAVTSAQSRAIPPSEPVAVSPDGTAGGVVSAGGRVPSVTGISSIADTFGWFTEAENARFSLPSVMSTSVARTTAVIGPATAFRSRLANSTAPPSTFALNTRRPVPPGPPPVAPQ